MEAQENNISQNSQPIVEFKSFKKGKGNLRNKGLQNTISQTKNELDQQEVNISHKRDKQVQEQQQYNLYKHQSQKTLQNQYDSGATKELQSETQVDRDNRAQREKMLQATLQKGAQIDDKSYKGLNQYIDYRAGFRRENHTAGAEKSTGAHGPVRASTNLRTTIQIDYQPNICKDYKETGFCSYGDSCKFLHDRSDYKSGWQLEKEWEEQQKRKDDAALRKLQRKLEREDQEPTKRQKQNSDSENEYKVLHNDGSSDNNSSDNDSETDKDGLPFACLNCHNKWNENMNPVKTKCAHYFCEQCALKANAKSGKCPVCKSQMQGIFNVAHEIQSKLRKQKFQNR